MPYTSINQLPEKAKKYSLKIRRQMLAVFNSTYSKVLKETNDKKEADKRAFQAMYSVLSKRMEQHSYNGINNHKDYFAYLQDSWLNKRR